MYIIDIAKKAWRKGMIAVHEKSPEILLGGGLVTIGVGVVDACRATLYADEIIEQHKREIEAVKEAAENELAKIEKAKAISEEKGGIYTDEQLAVDLNRIAFNTRKGITRVYLKSIGRFIMLYSRPLILILSGAFMITKSHDILTKRLTGAIAAYNVVSEQFKTYREKVADQYGKDADNRFLYEDIRSDKVIDSIDENGNHVDPNDLEASHNYNKRTSGYARYYYGAPNETANQAITKIMVARNYAQNLLESRGYLRLNEVYSLLGIPETSAGMVMGWIMKNGSRSGGIVDFGINGISFCNENNRFYADEFDHDHRILLDFNVDGVIYGKIEQAMAMA